MGHLECARFLGSWSGSWSQGYYGTQRIDVTHVSDRCVATLAYSPTQAPSGVTYQVAIRDGAMAFGCSVPGGACRLELRGEEMRATYTDPSGFVNIGTFRKAP